jgi:hypothetical protein
VITLHTISPKNEVEVAEHLERDIAACWPEVARSGEDRVDLLVGVRMSLDVDLLVVLDLVNPRVVGTDANGREIRITSGLIAVEIKQLDAQRFERVGNQLFARYEHVEGRSVVDQARDAAFAVKRFAFANGLPNLYVYGLAWLTQVDDAHLRGIDRATLGREAGWNELLTAAFLQSDALCRADGASRTAVRALRERLLLRRTLSPLDRKTAENVARDAVLADLVRGLAEYAGQKFVRIAGHGGSGKTTALTLLAAQLAGVFGRRVLILTFHQALCGDIRSIVEALPAVRAGADKNLSVQTATSFLLGILQIAGDVPLKADGDTDYDRLDAAYRAAADFLSDGAESDTVASIVASDRTRLDWDCILIDEAQDWSDAERDLLRAIYGHRRLVLADGLMQLVRRQVACDWTHGVPRRECESRILGKSLRMLRNVALFANAFARAAGLPDWNVEPHPALAGGRIVIVVGEIEDRLAVVAEIGTAAAGGNARPVDCLICVPHTEVEKLDGGVRRSRVGSELLAAGMPVWDASDAAIRASPPAGVESWRIIQYDSCRGLQGWAVLLMALDDLFTNKLKHPNLHDGDGDVDIELAARRWLLIPLTRAVHLLVIHVRDPHSAVATMLRTAAAEMPEGIVEWRSARNAGLGNGHRSSFARPINT